MFDYRSYRPGDESSIIELFDMVFHRPMSVDFWRWRFLDHPAGGPLIQMGFDGPTLAGHYAVCHAPLSIAGTVAQAALSMTTMTHPDYRGRRLFDTLGDELYERMRRIGLTAVYGFPNTNVHSLFITRLGWQDIHEVPTLTLEVSSATPRPVDPRVEEVPAIDARFTRLWAELAPTLPIAGLRDETLLAWRVDRNPVNTYTRLVLTEGADIAGYAITKAYGETDLDLVELRCSDEAAAKALVGAVTAKAAAEGRKRVATWSMARDVGRRSLEAAGYKPGAPVTYFGGRAFTDIGADLSDGRLWRISMLDSDLY